MKKVLFLIMVSILLISGCSYIADNKTTAPVDKALDNSPIADKAPEKAPVVSAGKSLDLSHKNLTKIDMSVFDKTNLEELNLSFNSLIDALPSQIGKLKKLKVLNASNNQMTGVPAEVGQLSNLEVLDLSNNQLTGLPNELANLKNLKTLNLSGNQYSEQDLSIIRDSLPNVEYILE